MMKATENRYHGVARYLVMALLFSMVLGMAGCATGKHVQKTGKHGQVPCPCEKNNKR